MIFDLNFFPFSSPVVIDERPCVFIGSDRRENRWQNPIGQDADNDAQQDPTGGPSACRILPCLENLRSDAAETAPGPRFVANRLLRNWNLSGAERRIEGRLLPAAEAVPVRQARRGGCQAVRGSPLIDELVDGLLGIGRHGKALRKRSSRHL